jgi:hypothetical protein
MLKNPQYYVIGALVTIVVILVLSVLLVAEPVARRMEPYRQNPPADTTINVPTDKK